MQELVELSAEDRDLAMSRFRLLQPHLEQDRPMRVVAAETGNFLSNGATLGGAVPEARLGGTGAKATGRSRRTPDSIGQG
jgi:hypothetical protein